MSKTPSSNQRFASPSPSESDKRYPQLEKIKRSLFPLLVGNEPPRHGDPRFADLVDHFAVRRSA